MIVVKLMAGLGNQMFQYSTARRLAHHHGVSLRLDVTNYQAMADVDTPRDYELDCYNIHAHVASKEELAQMLPIDFQATWPHRIKRRLGVDTRLRPLGEPSKYFYPAVLKARDNTWLVGWWQNEKYFEDIRNILLREFRPKTLSAKTKKTVETLRQTSSISVHVRRGDYVSNPHAKKHHGLVPLDYYERAIALNKSKVPEPKYFVFSDDISWCKRNLQLGDGAVFVDWNGPSRGCEDIWIMQHCQHNIMATSSFSWWGAWLNDNPKKTVIAPKRWLQDSKADAETEIIPDSWIRL